MSAPPMEGKLFPCPCKCEQARQQREDAEREAQRHAQAVEDLKRRGFTDAAMRTWTFDNDNGQCPQMKHVRFFVEHWEQMKAENIGYDSKRYFDLLPETVFLNIDGIIYDWQHETWNDAKYRHAMTSKILDVVLPQNPQICLNILRTFILQERYQMKISDKLKMIILREYKNSQNLSEFANNLMEEQFRRYGKEILTRRKIEAKVSNLI